jgi:diaminopimelate epimerase
MTRFLDFTKMHGAGNDLIVLDGLRDALPEDLGALSQRIADRRFGIGADQVLVLRPSRVAAVRMEIYDADGSQVEMCGNGIRAVFKYLRDRRVTDKDEIAVETLGGTVYPRWAGIDRVAVQMGRPIFEAEKIPTRIGSGDGPFVDVPLEVDGQRVLVTSLSMGNPHAVLFVADVDAAPVTTLGPRIEQHPAFPNRVNVEFVQVLGRDRVRQRTWERGTGETLACGSGACAVGVACILRGVTERAITVALRGGELQIEWASDDAGVLMTGPAAEVFTGRIAIGGE